MLIEPLRLALPFGGYNGGTIVTPDFSIVEQKLVPPVAIERHVLGGRADHSQSRLQRLFDPSAPTDPSRRQSRVQA